MRKTTLLLLCCGLVVMCSACNKAEPLPTESVPIVISATVITEENTDASSGGNKSVTTEKEESASAVSKLVEIHIPIIVEEEPKARVEIKEISEPTQKTHTQSEEKIVVQDISNM